MNDPILNRPIRHNLVVSVLKALCAKTTGVSRSAVVATVDNRVLFEHIVAPFMRRKISLDPRDVLIITAFFGKNTTEELKGERKRKQQHLADCESQCHCKSYAIHHGTKERVLPAMKANPDFPHSTAGCRTESAHQRVAPELT